MKVTQSCPTLCNPMDYTVHGILQARILEWVAFLFSRGSSQPRDQAQVSTLQADSLPAKPPGKPKNTRVGSLSLLQWIFLWQKLNPGLLHCRWILYQLSHQVSLRILEWVAYPFSSDLPDPGNEPESGALQEVSLPTQLPGKPTWEALKKYSCSQMFLYY